MPKRWSESVGAVRQRLLHGVRHAEMTKVCFAEALALQLNDFKCHHSEMIHSARVLNFGNDFPECAAEQTDLSVCARLCICAYVSHEEEDARISVCFVFEWVEITCSLSAAYCLKKCNGVTACADIAAPSFNLVLFISRLFHSDVLSG